MNPSTQTFEYIEATSLNHSFICELKDRTVYDYAVKFYQDGFHITILKNYSKVPNDKNWTKIRYEPEPDMTGVGIVSGTKINNGNFVYALDIDIYRPNRLESVYRKIINHIDKPVYIETTPSNGYRLFFYCRDNIIPKAIQFNFSEENDCAKHKDNVELFAGLKQVLTAPSKAINKNGIIKEYQQISETDLLESAVLNEYDVKQLINYLSQLSKKYSSQRFQHRHKVSYEHRNEIINVYQSLNSQRYITAPPH